MDVNWALKRHSCCKYQRASNEQGNHTHKYTGIAYNYQVFHANPSLADPISFFLRFSRCQKATALSGYYAISCNKTVFELRPTENYARDSFCRFARLLATEKWFKRRFRHCRGGVTRQRHPLEAVLFAAAALKNKRRNEEKAKVILNPLEISEAGKIRKTFGVFNQRCLVLITRSAQ